MKKYKYSLTILTVFLLAVNSAACSPQSPASNTAGPTETVTSSSSAIESGGYDSPEGAVKAYLEGLQANDLDLMVSAFAVESYVDHYSVQDYVEKIHGYFITPYHNLPAVNDFTRSLNIASRRDEIVNSIFYQYLALSRISTDNGSMIELKEPAQQKEFLAQLSEQLNSTDFHSLKILGTISPELLSDLYSSTANQDNLNGQAKVCGADKLVSRAAVIDLEDSKYILCFDTAEYNGKWFIEDLSGNISVLLGIHMNMSGIMPIDQQEEAELKAAIVPFP